MAGRVRRGAGPVDEGEVVAALAGEGLHDVHAYDDAPSARYPAHVHPFDKVLCCVSGAVVFTTDGGDLPLAPGDRLDLERGTEHSAVIGPAGVRLVEGHRTG